MKDAKTNIGVRRIIKKFIFLPLLLPVYKHDRRLLTEKEMFSCTFLLGHENKFFEKAYVLQEVIYDPGAFYPKKKLYWEDIGFVECNKSIDEKI